MLESCDRLSPIAAFLIVPLLHQLSGAHRYIKTRSHPTNSLQLDRLKPSSVIRRTSPSHHMAKLNPVGLIRIKTQCSIGESIRTNPDDLIRRRTPLM
jgi:hypothetical protein